MEFYNDVSAFRFKVDFYTKHLLLVRIANVSLLDFSSNLFLGSLALGHYLTLLLDLVLKQSLIGPAGGKNTSSVEHCEKEI